MATTREPIELRDRESLLIWQCLLSAPKIGIGEEELIRLTGVERKKILSKLRLLEEEEIITNRLQQVGTGGTSDHFYALLVPYKIMLVPQN